MLPRSSHPEGLVPGCCAMRRDGILQESGLVGKKSLARNYLKRCFEILRQLLRLSLSESLLNNHDGTASPPHTPCQDVQTLHRPRATAPSQRDRNLRNQARKYASSHLKLLPGSTSLLQRKLTRPAVNHCFDIKVGTVYCFQLLSQPFPWPVRSFPLCLHCRYY